MNPADNFNLSSYILGGDTHQSSTTLFHKDTSFGPMVSFRISDIFVKHNVKLSTKLFANISSSTFPMTFIKGTFYVFFFFTFHTSMFSWEKLFSISLIEWEISGNDFHNCPFFYSCLRSAKKIECVVFLHPFIKNTIGPNSP